MFLVIAQAEREEGAEVRHVLLKVGLDSIGHGADGHERLLVERGVLGAEHLEEELHQLVGEGARAVAQLLRHHLQRAAQQALQVVQRLLVVVGDDLNREGGLQPRSDDGQQLLDVRKRVHRRVGQRRVESLVRRGAQVVLVCVGTFGALQQRPRKVDKVRGQDVGLIVARVLAVDGERVQRGAHIGGDPRLVLEPRQQHALRLGRLARLQRVRHLPPLLR
mmetsp:Transcript_3318/g.11181  ORF Transcript_3318/g.11181 Transcript_3318/m.11181 type:complete len:220 (-) Transcript_3318:1401-2060(-)